jgi:hypothetical protein
MGEWGMLMRFQIALMFESGNLMASLSRLQAGY